MWQETSYSDWCLHRPENKQLVLVKADYNSQSSAVFIRKLLATIGSILKKKKNNFLADFLGGSYSLGKSLLTKNYLFSDLCNNRCTVSKEQRGSKSGRNVGVNCNHGQNV